jgi:hypothetical protein
MTALSSLAKEIKHYYSLIKLPRHEASNPIGNFPTWPLEQKIGHSKILQNFEGNLT